MLIHDDRNEDSIFECLQSLGDEEQKSLFPLPDSRQALELVLNGSRFKAGCCFVDPETNEIHVETSPYFDMRYRAYYLDQGEVRLGEEYIAEGENRAKTQLFDHTGPPVIVLSEQISNAAWYARSDSGSSFSCLDVGYQLASLSTLCKPNKLFQNAFYFTKEIGLILPGYEVPFNALLEQFGLRFEKSYGNRPLEERYKLIRLADGEVI